MARSASSLRHDQILVGFKPIDDLHREFQAIVDVLEDPAEADYAEILLALHQHLLRHCDAEEQFMLQENYPQYARHRAAHQQLLEGVSEARRRADAGDLDAVHRYATELGPWFVDHAGSEDCELARFLKGETAARPARAPASRGQPAPRPR